MMTVHAVTAVPLGPHGRGALANLLGLDIAASDWR